MENKEIIINMASEQYSRGQRVYTYKASEYELNFAPGFVVIQHRVTGDQEIIQANRVRYIEVKDV